MVAPYCAATHCETGVSYVYTLFCRLPHETGGFRASRTRASLPSSLSRLITAICFQCSSCIASKVKTILTPSARWMSLKAQDSPTRPSKS